jgi:myo-inositol-1(or 4)-monophosphatase
MKEPELRRALDEATAIAKQVGERVIAWSRDGDFEVRRKAGTEIVTTADLRSDSAIRDHLNSRFPTHRLLSEEVMQEHFDFSGPVWVIDPLDVNNGVNNGDGSIY